MATITSEAWTNQSPNNVNTYPHTYLLSSKTMRGSLFPLLPLRVKCQNHERVPISPISPILVVHALSSTWATKIGEIGTLSWFWPLRVKCQNHERVPISPISPILVVHVLTGWIDIGNHNRGNRGPFMVLALHQRKTLRGSLFPLFPLKMKCQNHERVPISPISPILVVHALARWKDRPWK